MGSMWERTLHGWVGVSGARAVVRRGLRAPGKTSSEGGGAVAALHASPSPQACAALASARGCCCWDTDSYGLDIDTSTRAGPPMIGSAERQVVRVGGE